MTTSRKQQTIPPKPPPSWAKIILGCAGTTFLIILFAAVSIAVFTYLLNVVLSTFGSSVVLDFWQGAAIYALLWMIGGFFRAVTR